jgi:hypothetical protein
MIRHSLRPSTFILGFLILLAKCSSAQGTDELRLVPQVDQRIERLSIVFPLAANSEYNMSPLSGYTLDIDSHFSTYKNHSAVLLAETLADKNGVGFDAVMAMAVHLTPPPALSPIVPFTDEIPDPRWSKSNGILFRQALHDFYRDANSEEFFLHRARYRLAENRFHAVLGGLDRDWYKNFYGKAPKGNFNVVLGMNNGGGNYGPKVIFANGHEELYAIIGCWSSDEMPLGDCRGKVIKSSTRRKCLILYC